MREELQCGCVNRHRCAGQISRVIVLSQPDALHTFYIVVAIIQHRIWNFSGVECAFQSDYGIFNRSLRTEAKFLLDAGRRDVIGSMIVGRSNDDLDPVADLFTHHLRDLHDLEIMIARVPGLAIDRTVRSFQQFQVQIGHVVDVEVRAQLLASEDRNTSLIDREIGKDVDRKIETQPRRITANGRRPQRYRCKSGLGLFVQHVLAQRLVF